MVQIQVMANSKFERTLYQHTYADYCSVRPMAAILHHQVCLRLFPNLTVLNADNHVGNYGKYAEYGAYKSDAVVKAREAEAAPAPAAENE